MTTVCQLASKYNMSIQQTSNGVANRFVKVVPFDKDRIKCCDTSRCAAAGPFDKPWEKAENGRRVTVSCWRLTCRKSNFTLGHCKSGNRVHQ